MRKTNKKLKKLAADKYGVILVTVIFIVAMALVFITTALTISIATRQRVYTNAKYQQARLTVTSLAQSVWQAIYSQQISDRDLVSLAKGTGGNGTLVSFTSNDVPGMGMGGTVATAYFYCVTPGDPSKIGIEFKCDIDGATDGACQYYTMVLERNKGEDLPPSAFHLPVNLGDGGELNSCNIGINAALSVNAQNNNQVRFDATDNICFLHNPTSSDKDGSGFYCHLICDGPVYLRNAVFAWDAYFLGESACMDFNGTSSTERALRGTDGSTSLSASNRQYGDLYFWGTSNPIRVNGGVPNSSAFEMYGINNMYFDYADGGSSHQFEHWSSTTFIDQNFRNVSGTLHYEDTLSARGGGATWQSHSSGWNPVEDNGMTDYMTVDPGEMDTIDEVAAKYDGELASATPLTTISNHQVLSGVYEISHSITLSDMDFSANISGGNCIIFITNGAVLTLQQNVNFTFNGAGAGDNRLIIILRDNAQLRICADASGNNIGQNCCIVDTNCYSGSNYSDATTLDQTTNPCCYILSEYLGGTPVIYAGNGGSALTASLGFFPQSTPDGGGGGRLCVNALYTNVYYGRISAGGIIKKSSNFFNIYYCPPENNGGPSREYAYRDNTDFSVVMDECEYFVSNS